MGNEFWPEYQGRIIGTAVALVVGIVYIFFGFFKTLIFSLIIFIGYYIGKKFDERENFLEIIYNILPDRFKNR